MKFNQRFVSNNGILAVIFTALILVAGCSSSSSDSESGTSTSAGGAAAATRAAPSSETTATVDTASEAVDEASFVVPFTAANGSGTVVVSGDGSPVVAWFRGLPGEVSLDLLDADVGDVVSVVEELVSFWFFQDDDSGDVPPNIYVSASGDITDIVGTRYVVEAQGLPPAPVAETTTTTSSTSTTTSTTSSVPETSEPPSATTSSTTTTSTSTTTTTTTTVVESPVVLQVQVLNGSGVAGAAGRMTDKLSQAGYVVLSPENAPQRYSSSAVYYQEGWKDRAEEILQAAEIEEIEAPSAMPQQFATEEAAVIVLLGTDTAPAVARSSGPLPRSLRDDVDLPLGDDVPRDRFVPGLADIQIYTRQNDEDPTTFNYIDSLQRWLRYVADFREDNVISSLPEDRGTYENLLAVYDSIEEVFDWLGFTPQNVCGAPAGYSFTDLLQPTREFSEETQSYRGNAIFTTERLLELHGGSRINPEANLDFYINQAVQTAYDILRSAELLDETEAPQLILCEAWISPSGEMPEYASAMWYALLTPGIQPRESLLSQGTYHMKNISKNGNRAFVYLCHPTLGAQGIRLHWREAGYRAESVNSRNYSGCQAAFEQYDNSGIPFQEETLTFAFGERVFSAGDLQGFPRASG